MYSLRIQLLIASILSAVGGALAFMYQESFLVSAAIAAGFVLMSYALLYIFVYRPILRIQRALDAQEEQALQRIIADSSDEFQRLSDSFNAMLDDFRTDIVRMKKLERIRSEFLGNVSHELRTPLFSTQGLIETLLHGAIDDKKVNKDFLRKALNNIERLNVLMEELIDISRIESGEMKLRLRYFDIIPMLISTVADLQPVADQRNISLTFSGDAGRGVEVFGDRERLRQVVENLIENGVKYTEKGGSVTVTFRDEPNRVHVCVKDTGIGIAPQHLSRIFERFYRVDKDRSRDVGGTGLGLAIVKHIIEAHDSNISVESDVGRGSTFSFYLNKSYIE